MCVYMCVCVCVCGGAERARTCVRASMPGGYTLIMDYSCLRDDAKQSRQSIGIKDTFDNCETS